MAKTTIFRFVCEREISIPLKCFHIWNVGCVDCGGTLTSDILRLFTLQRLWGTLLADFWSKGTFIRRFSDCLRLTLPSRPAAWRLNVIEFGGQTVIGADMNIHHVRHQMPPLSGQIDGYKTLVMTCPGSLTLPGLVRIRWAMVTPGWQRWQGSILNPSTRVQNQNIYMTAMFTYLPITYLLTYLLTLYNCTSEHAPCCHPCTLHVGFPTCLSTWIVTFGPIYMYDCTTCLLSYWLNETAFWGKR